MGMGFSCRKHTIFPGAHKVGAAISGPRIAGKDCYGHEDFLRKMSVTFGDDVRKPRPLVPNGNVVRSSRRHGCLSSIVDLQNSLTFFGNAPLFILLFVRIFWRVCSQFWLSVRNSV